MTAAAEEESVTIGIGDSVLLLPDSHFSLVPALESSSSSLRQTCSLLTDPQGLSVGLSLALKTVVADQSTFIYSLRTSDWVRAFLLAGIVPGCFLVTLTITIPAKESLTAITAADFQGRKAGKSSGGSRRGAWSRDDGTEEEAEYLGTLSSRASEALLDSPLVNVCVPVCLSGRIERRIYIHDSPAATFTISDVLLSCSTSSTAAASARRCRRPPPLANL